MHHDSFWRPEPDLPETQPDSPKKGAAFQKAFTREKFNSLDQMRADPQFTPLAFLIACVLTNLVSKQKGCAWASNAHLAPDRRVTEKNVQKVIQRLAERGRLLVEMGAGRSPVLYAVTRHLAQPNADRKEAQR